MGRASVPTPALYPAFFFVLGKAAKAQETQSYQRIQHIVHTVFNTSGANAPRSLSHLKVGTHSALLKESHTAAHTAKQGPSGRGRYHYHRSVPHVHKHPRAGYQNGKLCRFGVWPGALPKNAESLRDSDALMRVAVPRRRSPAGLRDLFRFCRNCGLYTLRSELSACMR